MKPLAQSQPWPCGTEHRNCIKLSSTKTSWPVLLVHELLGSGEKPDMPLQHAEPGLPALLLLLASVMLGEEEICIQGAARTPPACSAEPCTTAALLALLLAHVLPAIQLHALLSPTQLALVPLEPRDEVL